MKLLAGKGIAMKGVYRGKILRPDGLRDDFHSLFRTDRRRLELISLNGTMPKMNMMPDESLRGTRCP